MDGPPARSIPPITTVSSAEVFANRWLRLRQDAISYADGMPGHYTVVERADFAVVVAAVDGGFWLVEQYRYPLQRRCWELPQGGWPPGRGGSPEELARAELREETGLRAGRWQHLGRLAAAPGLMTQYFDVFAASELIAGEPDREASEADMVHRWVPIEEVRAMIADGRMVDAHSIAALTLYRWHADNG